MRLVFCGSPPFATAILERLIEGPHRPVAVVTQPTRAAGRGRGHKPSPVAELAKGAQIEVLAPDSLKDEAFRSRLAEIAPDLALVASYGELIDRQLLAVPKLGWINVHGSLLPRWRGASPVQAAILAGDATTGVSIQRVVRRLDAGDVCHAIETPIGERETGGELTERLSDLGARAAVEALELIAAGAAEFVPQDRQQITKCSKLTKADGRLDWALPAIELERRVRAMTPWPGATTTLPGGEALKLAQVGIRESIEGAPGEVRLVDGQPQVRAGEGSLALERVQPPGKRVMDAGDWWRGARLEEGLLLGGEVQT